MNPKSEHVKMVWDRENRTAKVTVNYHEVDGCLYAKGDQSFELDLKEAKDAWVDLNPILRHIAKGVHSPRIRLNNGKLIDIMLWLPLMDALQRFTEVIDLGLPLEPNE